jgi:hypothetical protein
MKKKRDLGSVSGRPALMTLRALESERTRRPALAAQPIEVL